MNDLSFTQEEWIPYLGMLLTVTVIVISNYYRGFREFWSPLTIIAVIFGYYCCLGPYQAITSGDTHDRLLNMRPFYVSALWGAFVSFLSYIVGFHANRATASPEAQSLPVEALFEYGRKTFFFGFILFTISTGGNVTKLINPLDAQYVEQVGGSIANYLGLSLNFLIPGLALIFAYVIITRKKMLWFIIPFFVTLGIFISLGFRYRIVLLGASMAIIYFYIARKRPNLILAPLGVLALIVFMGIINISRQYGAGLNTRSLEGGTTTRYYKSGLRESLIFQTSGAVIDIVPEKHPHAGIEPIAATLLFPVPSSIFPEKKSGEYLFSTLDSIYGKKVSKGAAIMAYGEYYLAFGWLGIIVGGIITGWFYKRLWVWYKSNHRNPFVIVAYALTVTYLYVILSRGYLPQVTMLFFFTVFPIYVVLRWAKKKYFVRPIRRRTINQ